LIAIAFFYFPTSHVEEVPMYCDPWSRNLNKTAGIGEGGEGGGGGEH
jgi:hypothetical protein